jgi:hypothetical protein
LVALIEIDRAEKSGSLDDLKSSMNRLTSALHSGDFSSFQTPDVQELGRKLGDIMVADHTVANKANSTLSASIVFIFGAALSTYLASELMDKSFHGNIGVATLGEWALYYFGFLSTVFTLGSKFMWEKYYLPGFEKIHERVSKLVGKEVMPKIKSENLDKSENSEKSRYTRAKQSGQKRCVDF